jgi:acyl-CoA synthetase
VSDRSDGPSAELSAPHPIADLRVSFLEHGWWREQTLADDVDRHARERPDAPAFITPAGRLTWGQYAQISQDLAAVLIEAGHRRGDRIAVQLPDAATVHVALLAVEKAGLVAVGIGARAGARELRHLLGKTGATGLITHADHRDQDMSAVVADLRSEGFPIRTHLALPRFDLEPEAPISRNGTAMVLPPTRIGNDKRRGADELWLINSTSGTTGLPKCVMHAQNRWHYFHRVAVDVGALSQDDIFLAGVPAPFGFGQWTSHVTPTILGAPAVVMERFRATDALDLIDHEKATVLCAVSTQFVMMLNEEDAADPPHRLDSLRVMFTGGEMIPYERALAFEERTGARVLNFYGSNESGFATATTVRDTREHRLRTAGTVQPGTEVRLYDEHRQITDTGRGQPASRGPAICLGYLDDPAANAELFIDDGWVLHADEVDIDADGYLRVVGRRSDIIIRGGKNISAPQVEDDVNAHPVVALAAAVASPDPIFGERVCVYVELRAGASLTLEQLTLFLQERQVSTESLPERLVVVDELPRSSGGKIAKGELREDAKRRFGSSS